MVEREFCSSPIVYYIFFEITDQQKKGGSVSVQRDSNSTINNFSFVLFFFSVPCCFFIGPVIFFIKFGRNLGEKTDSEDYRRKLNILRLTYLLSILYLILHFM